MRYIILKEISKLRIASYKQQLQSYYGLFAFGLLASFFNALLLYRHISTHRALTGGIIGTCLYGAMLTWFNISETRLSLRLEREKLAWLEKQDAD